MKAPKPETTPTRTSARLAQAKLELSGDEDEGPKAIPNPSHRVAKGRTGLFSFIPDLGWLQTLFLTVLGPLVLVSLHTLAKDGVWKPAVPQLSRRWQDYWDRNSFLSVLSLVMAVRILSYIPLGSKVRAVNGQNVRLNGKTDNSHALSIFSSILQFY